MGRQRAAAFSVVIGVWWSAGLSGGAWSPFFPRTQSVGAPANGSVLDGVYTGSQAARGEQTFQKLCMSCHTVAEHTGRKFGVMWAGKTMGDLFDIVSNTMPEADPGSLTPDEYAGILAFFLRASGYPEGQQELPSDLPALMRLRIEPLAR
jgi:hypothetical protein